MMLDHSKVRKVRDRLGVSQVALARDTGINRTVLSGFETGQLVLGQECTRKLADFFLARGIQLEDIASLGDIRPFSMDGARLRLMGDYLVAPGISPDRAKVLLAELYSVEWRIGQLEQAKCQKGLLGTFMEECEKERQELLVLNARWRCLVLELQGKRVPEAHTKTKTPINQAEWLGQVFDQLLHDRKTKA